MTMAGGQRSIKWVEGLRGLTSVLVIVTHMARAWDYAIFFPSNTPEAVPRLVQLPIVRIPFQGGIGVPIFAFLTGFVCAYKPLHLAYQQGNAPAALHAIARSAFRRTPRLVLPAILATFISFVLSCLGGYRAANHCDNNWVRLDAPDLLPSFGQELVRFLNSSLTTWTTTTNPYDRHQWAMRRLLIGAFQVYLTLAATIGLRFRYRIWIHILMILYWQINVEPFTETFGVPLAWGTLLAELSIHRPTQNFIVSHRCVLSSVVSPLLMLIGLGFGSYPHESPQWQPWSNWMYNTLVHSNGDVRKGTFLVPTGTDARRRMTSIMIQFGAVSVFLSPVFRDMLSWRGLMWLGRHSFAVYLVHGSILRTVGIWISYGISGEPFTPGFVDPEGTRVPPQYVRPKSVGHILLAMFVFISLTYLAAWAWVRWVDSSCARFTVWLEHKVFDEEDSVVLAEQGYSSVPQGSVNGEEKPSALSTP